MKKGTILFFILVMVVTILSGCKKTQGEEILVNAETFPGEELRNIVLKHADTNQDGRLDTAEIRGFKKLYLDMFLDVGDLDAFEDDKEFQVPTYTKADYKLNLAGIEQLRGLKEVTLNMLSSKELTRGWKEYVVEVSNLEKLYELENLSKLEIYGGDIRELKVDRLTKIEELTISTEVEFLEVDSVTLKRLTLSDSPALEEITFSNAPDLKTLYVENNRKLQQVRFEENCGIEEIVCKDQGKITRIESNGLKNLKRLTLENVDYQEFSIDSIKNLESLQVERVRGLKYLILEGFRELKELAILDCFDMEELVLYNTELTSLRMNGLDMKKLSIDGLNKSSLEQLNVFENTNLSSIDVGEYPKLKELVIGENTEVLNNSNEELKITVWDSGN